LADVAPATVRHPTLVFTLLAVLHVYIGGGHLLHLVQHPISWTDIWKGFGAIFGAYYFIVLAVRPRG
jgi:hypothetical protein